MSLHDVQQSHHISLVHFLILLYDFTPSPPLLKPPTLLQHSYSQVMIYFPFHSENWARRELLQTSTTSVHQSVSIPTHSAFLPVTVFLFKSNHSCALDPIPLLTLHQFSLIFSPSLLTYSYQHVTCYYSSHFKHNKFCMTPFAPQANT